MNNETVITLAADIVSAHVGNNSVATLEVPRLIQTVYAALASAAAPVLVAEETHSPAVSIRSAVKPESIACLECGKRFKLLKRHLSTDHGLTPAEYRARWGLAANYPMVAPRYAAKRSELAVMFGLGGRRRGRLPRPAPPE